MKKLIYELCTWYGFNDFVKDFVWKTTDLAVSILTQTLIDHSCVVGQVSRYVECLKDGVDCTYLTSNVRSRRGLRALEVLHKGGVLRYVADHPDFSAKMYERLKRIAKEIAVKMLSPPDNFYRGDYYRVKELLKDFKGSSS
ncbi:MAG: hypothetical protein L0Z68_04135 [Gammaproteobacteria bacterium]|nr:hypothetical protein [Gammaproteobacteria bacterium]